MLLDTPTLTISHSQPEDILLVHWIGPHDEASARQGCRQLLACVQQTHCRRLLNDGSEAYGEWWPAARWIGEDFLPQLADAGVRALAWINSMDWPSRHGVASTMHHAHGPQIQIFDFDQQDAARQWLRTFPL
jgi:SpoIIAA-like